MLIPKRSDSWSNPLNEASRPNENNLNLVRSALPGKLAAVFPLALASPFKTNFPFLARQDISTSMRPTSVSSVRGCQVPPGLANATCGKPSFNSLKIAPLSVLPAEVLAVPDDKADLFRSCRNVIVKILSDHGRCIAMVRKKKAWVEDE